MNPAALVLAAVFTWAAVAKLRDRPGTERSLTELGIPAPGAVSVVLPVGELVLAAVLVLAPTIGATVALGALSAFTTQLVLARRRGATVGCGCFGGARPLPPRAELGRNAALAALALVAVVTA